jgi:uncharacterized membrane protein YphA (DoxX/SURF4 family)
VTTFLTIFSSLSFLAYGVACFSSAHMRREFERYGLPRQRILTGLLEILGAAGLLVGLFIPVIGILAALGLSLLMFLGFLVRLKIKDGPLKSSPALLYMLLNLYLFLTYLTSTPSNP